MGPKIVSLVSSFRSTQVVRPIGKQTWSGACTGPGVGSAGEGHLCGFRVAGSEMQAVPLLTSLTFGGLLLPSSLGYFLSRVPWSHLSKKILASMAKERRFLGEVRLGHGVCQLYHWSFSMWPGNEALEGARGKEIVQTVSSV